MSGKTRGGVTSLYRRDEVIGRGNFGVVYKGVNLETKQAVAIKVLNLDTVEDELPDIQQEISTLSKLTMSDAANIIKYYGSYLNGHKLWIIMDLCAGGSVRTLLKPGPFEERHIMVIVREVCIALAYIHKEGIIHRDMKAANILITTSGQVRLCDFGVAAQTTAMKLKRSTIVGTPYWMAPEVITEGALYNTKADIWSFGVTVYEIVTGNPPYSDQEAFRAIMLIPRQKPARLEGSQYSPALKEFVAHCLDEHPDERPTADELMKLKFIKASRGYPTSILRELVTRYMSWKERNNVRDSIAMLKGIKDDDEKSVDGYNSDSDDSRWDFDTSDLTTFDYDNIPTNSPVVPGGGSTPEDLESASPQFNTATYQTSAMPSQQSTIRGGPMEPVNTIAEAPASLMQLFEDASQPSVSPATQSIDLTSSGILSATSGILSSTTPGMPGTPTVEIEIPEFDALEVEPIAPPSTAVASAANTLARGQFHSQMMPPPPAQLPQVPQMPNSQQLAAAIAAASHGPPPQPPPQSSKRSRSNTLTNLRGESPHAPVVPPIPSISTIASASPQQQTSPSSQYHELPPPPPQQLPSGQMRPPTMPYAASSTRRTPSPKRMTPLPSSAPASAASTVGINGGSGLGLSPPKPATSMKPLITSKLSQSETHHSDDTNDSHDNDTPNLSKPQIVQSSFNHPAPPNQLPLRKGPTSVSKRAQQLHIAMPPPPSLSFSGGGVGSLPASSTGLHHPISIGGPATGGLDDPHFIKQQLHHHHAHEDNLSLPPLPKLDTSVLLDTTPRPDVIAHLDTLLEVYFQGLSSIEEGLYNLAM
ncbi:serine/threonine-protein kinase Kic1p [Trichomonascus vanleenenianus]|uniref:putative serine/threonine protein kinase SPS1 n=1 Tax=Trichomonascus vanleenenianus TaxID=2268995 RepID=UPI003ECA75D6